MSGSKRTFSELPMTLVAHGGDIGMENRDLFLNEVDDIGTKTMDR
jgi:hypothetical protein